MVTPTLQELMDRIKNRSIQRKQMLHVYRQVACGNRGPLTLSTEMLNFAVQTAVILLYHIDTHPDNQNSNPNQPETCNDSVRDNSNQPETCGDNDAKSN